jgi:O-antigen ligase
LTAPANTFAAQPAHTGWSFRLLLVCFLALSASLPIAMMSLGKLLLFVAALGYFIEAKLRDLPDRALQNLLSPRLLVLILGLFALSLFWTHADLDTALTALVKHGKLLVIVLLASLIRTAREGRIALLVFAIGQFALLALSWLLVAGLPWPPAPQGASAGVVFSSYLDQSIIFATSAAVIWHLHGLNATKPLWPRWLACAFVLAALASVFQVLIGRTAYVVALALIGLALLWSLPPKLRLPTLVGAPLLILLAVFMASSHLPARIGLVFSESRNFSEKSDITSSSGWRLNAWQRSIEAIAEKPAQGHGVGAWSTTVKRLQGPNGAAVFGAGSLSNPHQEYLLWGVELGVGGILLLLLLHLALARDFAGFVEPVWRAGASVTLAMAIACLFNSSIYDGLIGDYFCIVLGLLLGLGLRSGKTPSTTQSGRNHDATIDYTAA